MEALNVPCTRGPICTFWEAEIIDNIHHTFYTHKWGASKETDIAHWSRFAGWSARIRMSVIQNGGRSPVLPNHTHVFLRMKEQFYVNAGAECGLTIAGGGWEDQEGACGGTECRRENLLGSGGRERGVRAAGCVGALMFGGCVVDCVAFGGL